MPGHARGSRRSPSTCAAALPVNWDGPAELETGLGGGGEVPDVPILVPETWEPDGMTFEVPELTELLSLFPEEMGADWEAAAEDTPAEETSTLDTGGGSETAEDGATTED